MKQDASVATRFTDYMTLQQPIDAGFVLEQVLDLVAIEHGGREGLRQFCSSLEHSAGGTRWADEICHAFE